MPDVAVITGASAGIGAMFARKLAARHYDLLLIARREDRLKSLAAELSETYHVHASAMTADLADPAELERVAEHVESLPDLGLMVNNAGFGLHGIFWESDIEGQAAMHRLHVIATMRLTHAALRNMVPRGRGGVINVASVAGFMAAPGSVSYNSTKAWMINFTEGIAMELAGKQSQVRAQALCPGFTLSEFHDVVGMDRSGVPQSLWMSADFVVEESLKAFDRGQVIVVPGWRYKLITGALQVMPRSLARKFTARSTRQFRRKRTQPQS
jgi:short-subunit dehydrogenase